MTDALDTPAPVAPPTLTAAVSPTPAPPARIGPYAVTRALVPGPHGARALALHDELHTSHTLHLLHKAPGLAPRAFAGAMARLQQLEHKHILRPQAFGWEPDVGPWAVTDYTGDADGIVTLDQLIRVKGGWLSPEETRRALEQLLDAARSAHAHALPCGTIDAPQVQVNRAGQLQVEFYALRFALSTLDMSGADRADAQQEAQRQEVRAIVRLGYQLITGLLPIAPIIPVEDVIERIDVSWRDFFETGLGPTGFTSAAHAYSAASACRLGADSSWAMGPVRSVWRGVTGTR
jgi:hypothetical protein